MDTKAHLFGQYGPLLTYAQLAQILDRTVGGLKASMSRLDNEAARKLHATKVRIGGRAYFRTQQVAELLEKKADGSGEGVE